MIQVIVEVYGGLITRITTSDKNNMIEIVVNDYDNLEEEKQKSLKYHNETEEHITKMIKDNLLKVIY